MSKRVSLLLAMILLFTASLAAEDKKKTSLYELKSGEEPINQVGFDERWAAAIQAAKVDFTAERNIAEKLFRKVNKNLDPKNEEVSK